MRRRRVPFRELIWRLSRGQAVLILCWLMAADLVAVWWRQDFKRHHEMLMETRADSFLVLHQNEIEDQVKNDRSVAIEADPDVRAMESDVRLMNLNTMLMPIAGIFVIGCMFAWEWGVSGMNFRRRKHAQGTVLSMEEPIPGRRNGRGGGIWGRIRRGFGRGSTGRSGRRRRRTKRA